MPTTDEYTLQEIAAQVGKSTPNVSNMLRLLIADQLVEKTGRGRYARVVPNEESKHHEDDEDGEDGEVCQR